jgi:hypothetical protein
MGQQMGRLRVKPKLDRMRLMACVHSMRAQGQTQTTIAIELGCAPSTVQKWLWAERCETNAGSLEPPVRAGKVAASNG